MTWLPDLDRVAPVDQHAGGTQMVAYHVEHAVIGRVAGTAKRAALIEQHGARRPVDRANQTV